MNNIATVTELEAQVLDGQNVSPEQLAQAKASEDATIRIDVLKDQKRIADERSAKIAKYEQLQAELGEEFDETYKKLRLENVNKKLQEIVVEFYEVAEAETDMTRELVRKARAYMAECPGAQAVVSGVNHGGDQYAVHRDGRRITEAGDWATKVNNCFEEGLQEARRLFYQKYPQG